MDPNHFRRFLTLAAVTFGLIRLDQADAVLAGAARRRPHGVQPRTGLSVRHITPPPSACRFRVKKKSMRISQLVQVR